MFVLVSVGELVVVAATEKSLREQHHNYTIDWKDPEDLEYGDHLGDGRFSVVYRGRVKSTGQEVAIKQLKPLEGWRLGREVEFLEKVKGTPWIINLVGVYGNDMEPLLVTDLALDDNRSPQTEGELRFVMRHLLRALNHTHYNRIIHRDVKLGNLKISFKHRQVKLMDYGLAEWAVAGMPLSVCGTRVYKAPEQLTKNCSIVYGTPVDIWGAGAVLANMLLGVPAAFYGGTDGKVLERQRRILGDAAFAVFDAPEVGSDGHPLRDYLLPHTKSFASREAFEFAEFLLQPDPAKRPTAVEALCHPWFGGPFGEDEF